MSEVTLKDINTRLIKTDEELAEAMTQLLPMELEYEGKRRNFMLRSQMPNQAKQEAEAYELLQQEAIFEKYHEQVLKVKILTQRLRTLQTVSSNIKSYAYDTT